MIITGDFQHNPLSLLSSKLTSSSLLNLCWYGRQSVLLLVIVASVTVLVPPYFF